MFYSFINLFERCLFSSPKVPKKVHVQKSYKHTSTNQKNKPNHKKFMGASNIDEALKFYSHLNKGNDEGTLSLQHFEWFWAQAVPLPLQTHIGQHSFNL